MTQSNEGLPKGIGAPATRALTAAGYIDLEQLAGVPKSELERLHGVGPKALRIIQEELENRGQSLG
jgi:predicted flap endonuclease-1-like 5' DNA nuclease